MLQVQPLIVTDSMEVGQKWGQQCTQRVLKQLREKGYLRKPSAARRGRGPGRLTPARARA